MTNKKDKTTNPGELEQKVEDLEARVKALEDAAGIGGVHTEDSSNPGPVDPPPHH